MTGEITLAFVHWDGFRRNRRGGCTATHEVIRPITSRKREALVRWLTSKDRGRSVKETMRQFGITRPALRSALTALRREHGVGYVMQEASVRLVLPESGSLFE